MDYHISLAIIGNSRGEQSDSEIEDLWAFHSDSVRVFAEDINLTPEQENVEDASGMGTLYGNTRRTLTENLAARTVIDDFYQEYDRWCSRKQIEPVKPKAFSARLGNLGYTTKRRLIEGGKFAGKKKYVIYATWSDDYADDEGEKKNRSQSEISWEAYVEKAPLIFDLETDSRVHLLAHGKNEDKKIYIIMI